MRPILFWNIVWTLLTSLNFSDSSILHYSTSTFNISTPLEEEGSISCICGKKKIEEPVPKNSLDNLFEGIRNHMFCTENFKMEICKFLKECSKCSAEVRKCRPVPYTAIAFKCTTKRLEKHDVFIKKLKTKADLKLFGLARKRRKVNTCSYPKRLMTADVICHKFQDSLICKQKCLFGYTLKEGITREMSCFHSENVWIPVGFEECRPYIDCSLTLTHGGEVNCFTGTDEKFLYCNITCAQNDKELESHGFYRCQMDGSWTPKLPFCVTSGSGIDLVPSPWRKDSSI